MWLCQERDSHISLLALAASSQLADVSYFIDHDNQRDAHKTNNRHTRRQSVSVIYTRKRVSFPQHWVLRCLFPSLFPHPPTRIVYLNFDCEPILPEDQGTAC